MIHYSIETVMKEAEESWERHNRSKGLLISEGHIDVLGKVSFMYGWLQEAYKKMYADLPPNKKPNLENQYMQIWEGK